MSAVLDHLLFQTLVISALIQLIAYLFSSYLRPDRIVGPIYGLGFLALTGYNLYYTGINTPMAVLLTGMVILWSLRLIGYWSYRTIKTNQHDPRFDEIRNPIRTISLWGLQALTVWVAMWPVTIALSSIGASEPNVLTIIGFSVWLLGLLLETAADVQKFQFKINPLNKNKWVDTGLWKYSRHPNYFGEILIWWGIFLVCFPQFSQSWHTIAIISPLLITIRLLYLTGIPPLQRQYVKKFKGNAQYQNYLAHTNLLIPFPKSMDKPVP